MMPRVKRKPLKSKGWTDAHVFQLVHGRDFFGNAFGHDMEAMREAWPELRDRVFTMTAERRRHGHKRIRPWAWWQFESPKRRDGRMTEAQQLKEMGISDGHARSH